MQQKCDGDSVTSIPHLFQATNGLRVPDTTFVFPFLNSNDTNIGLRSDLLEAFSLALGEIEPDSSSKIHVHPRVTQLTLVLNGRLEVSSRMTSRLSHIRLA